LVIKTLDPDPEGMNPGSGSGMNESGSLAAEVYGGVIKAVSGLVEALTP
jgi:hypothetical protein